MKSKKKSHLKIVFNAFEGSNEDADSTKVTLKMHQGNSSADSLSKKEKMTIKFSKNVAESISVTIPLSFQLKHTLPLLEPGDTEPIRINLSQAPLKLKLHPFSQKTKSNKKDLTGIDSPPLKKMKLQEKDNSDFDFEPDADVDVASQPDEEIDDDDGKNEKKPIHHTYTVEELREKLGVMIPSKTAPSDDIDVFHSLAEALKVLQSKDPYNVFANPVPKDVPYYYDIITYPMDFSTMWKKLKSKSTPYITLQPFRDDFNKMCENAMIFNESNTLYHREARKLLKFGKKHLDSIEKRWMHQLKKQQAIEEEKIEREKKDSLKAEALQRKLEQKEAERLELEKEREEKMRLKQVEKERLRKEKEERLLAKQREKEERLALKEALKQKAIKEKGEELRSFQGRKHEEAEEIFGPEILAQPRVVSVPRRKKAPKLLYQPGDSPSQAELARLEEIGREQRFPKTGLYRKRESNEAIFFAREPQEVQRQKLSEVSPDSLLPTMASSTARLDSTFLRFHNQTQVDFSKMTFCPPQQTRHLYPQHYGLSPYAYSSPASFANQPPFSNNESLRFLSAPFVSHSPHHPLASSQLTVDYDAECRRRQRLSSVHPLQAPQHFTSPTCVPFSSTQLNLPTAHPLSLAGSGSLPHHLRLSSESEKANVDENSAADSSFQKKSSLDSTTATTIAEKLSGSPKASSLEAVSDICADDTAPPLKSSFGAADSDQEVVNGVTRAMLLSLVSLKDEGVTCSFVDALLRHLSTTADSSACNFVENSPTQMDIDTNETRSPASSFDKMSEEENSQIDNHQENSRQSKGSSATLEVKNGSEADDPHAQALLDANVKMIFQLQTQQFSRSTQIHQPNNPEKVPNQEQQLALKISHNLAQLVASLPPTLLVSPINLHEMVSSMPMDAGIVPPTLGSTATAAISPASTPSANPTCSHVASSQAKPFPNSGIKQTHGIPNPLFKPVVSPHPSTGSTLLPPHQSQNASVTPHRVLSKGCTPVLSSIPGQQPFQSPTPSQINLNQFSNSSTLCGSQPSQVAHS